MTEVIKSIRGSAPVVAESEKPAEKRSVAWESIEKSSFALAGKQAWRSFVAGDVSGDVPSEEVQPLRDALETLGALEDNGLPDGGLGPISTEAHEQSPNPEEATVPDLIHKSQYATEIEGIMGTMMLGNLEINKPKASDLQIPAVPDLEVTMKNSGGTPDDMSALLKKYDAARKATLALLNNTETALKSGRVNYYEVQALQEYVHLLQGNLLHIEQQMDRARFIQDTKNILAEANHIRDEQREDEENGIFDRPF